MAANPDSPTTPTRPTPEEIRRALTLVVSSHVIAAAWRDVQFRRDHEVLRWLSSQDLSVLTGGDAPAKKRQRKPANRHICSRSGRDMRFWVVGPCPGCREGDDENDSAKLPDPLEMQTALARCGIEWDTDFDSPEFYTWAVTGLESGGESADSCYDAIQRMLTAKDPDDFSGGDAPATAPELMFWRWAYGLNLVAAKQALELRKIEQRAAGEEKNWPGQQEWSDLVGTSHSVFLREARELAGIDHETFLAFARNQHGSAFAEIADELYDAALKPTARAALLTPSEIGESE